MASSCFQLSNVFGTRCSNAWFWSQNFNMEQQHRVHQNTVLPEHVTLRLLPCALLLAHKQPFGTAALQSGFTEDCQEYSDTHRRPLSTNWVHITNVMLLEDACNFIIVSSWAPEHQLHLAYGTYGHASRATTRNLGEVDIQSTEQTPVRQVTSVLTAILLGPNKLWAPLRLTASDLLWAAQCWHHFTPNTPLKTKSVT